jgi:hypothetical protein
MIRRIHILLTATAAAVLLLWLLAGCTNGKGDGAGQQQRASEDESSSSRTTTPTPPAKRTATSAKVGSARSMAASDDRPNFVLVVTDDLTKRDYFDLGRNLSTFTSGGTFFQNAFVTTALCCPSRASILTGLYAHNHHITQHIDTGTGYEQYHSEGYDQKDLPVWLKDAGYETGLVGNYMNKYDAQSDGIPTGWTDWYGADRQLGVKRERAPKGLPAGPDFAGLRTLRGRGGGQGLKVRREGPRLGPAVLPLVRHSRPSCSRARSSAR